MFPLHFLTTVITPKVGLRASLEVNLLDYRVERIGVRTIERTVRRRCGGGRILPRLTGTYSVEDAVLGHVEDDVLGVVIVG